MHGSMSLKDSDYKLAILISFATISISFLIMRSTNSENGISRFQPLQDFLTVHQPLQDGRSLYLP